MFDWLYDLLLFILYALIALILPFIVMGLIFFIYYRFIKK